MAQTSSGLPAIGRVALAEHVSNAIYENLLNLTITPGGRINIEAIARQLEVSPTPVREALARLEAEELVVKRPMAGYLAGPLMTVDMLIDLIDLRLHIEPWLARTAAAVTDKRLRQSVKMLLADAAAPNRSAAAARLDAAVHDQIAAVAGNESARQVLQRLKPQYHTYRFLATHNVVTDPLRDHRSLADAIAAGDPRAAQQEMRTHLAEARSRILAANT